MEMDRRIIYSNFFVTVILLISVTVAFILKSSNVELIRALSEARDKSSELEIKLQRETQRAEMYEIMAVEWHDAFQVVQHQKVVEAQSK